VQAEAENTTDSSTTVESSAPVVESSTPSTETTVSETQGEQSKESLMDAVLKVVEPTPEPTVTSETSEEAPPASDEQGEVKAEDESSEETEQDDSSDDEQAPPEATAAVRKKVNKLLRQRRELRDEVAQLRAPAEIGQQLANFQQANGLDTGDIVEALDILTLVKRGDYQGFYDRLAPLIRHAQEVIGVVLPSDLQQRVSQGQMTAEAARELATTRFERANYEVQTRQMHAQQQSAHVHRVKDDVQRSVSSFEERLAASDPDYAKKQDAIRRVAQARLFERGGRIQSVEEALQITQEAYNEVNAQFRRLQPAVRATTPTPGRSNPQTPQSRPQPKSLMDAVKMALDR